MGRKGGARPCEDTLAPAQTHDEAASTIQPLVMAAEDARLFVARRCLQCRALAHAPRQKADRIDWLGAVGLTFVDSHPAVHGTGPALKAGWGAKDMLDLDRIANAAG